MDRRVAIQWMLTATAAAVLARGRAWAAPAAAQAPGDRPGAGYGMDLDLLRSYKPGDLWPLTLSEAQRRQVAALCDLVIPADDRSPSASAVGVPDFIDEFVSAPYPDNVAEGRLILDGLAWLDRESARRFGCAFADAAGERQAAFCEEMSRGAQAGAESASAADFFLRFRNLVVTGFYTTPAGMKDLEYVGNVPLARFDGPPAELVARLGLADEVKW